MIKIKDFAQQQGVSDKAVYKHLKKYTVELEGHISKQGQNGTYLDDYACDFIASHMVNKNVVELSDASLSKENDRLKTELIDAQKMIIQLQNENSKLKIENNKVLLLENDFKNAQATAEKNYNDAEKFRENWHQEQERTKDLEKENDRLRNRSLIDRVLNRF